MDMLTNVILTLN